jgi:hypothetical protein
MIYIVGLIIGTAFVASLMTWPEITGVGGLWRYPIGDLAQNLTGHLAYQTSSWSWPLLRADNLFAPHGLTIAMTDSNPLVSIVAKVIETITGQPHNLLGYWCASCFLLQPIAAIYAIRGFNTRRTETEIAAALLSICFPAFLARFAHINLLGHFYLLFALGIAIRDVRNAPRRPGYGWRFVLLLGAVLCHPYLFVFSSMILSARMWGAIILRDMGWRSELLRYLCLLAAVFATYLILSGTLGGGDIGFEYYSMNLFSPVWPHGSWFFPHLPVMDATGGQYEGYNYLGAGALLALFLAVGKKLSWRRWTGLIFVLFSMTLLALSAKVYAGHHLLLSLGLRPWRQLFGPVQSSGRAFWAVGYFITFASLVAIERFPRWFAAIALVFITGLQMIDTSPLHAATREAFSSTGTQIFPLFTMPSGTRLLTFAAPCSADAKTVGPALELEAIRTGAALSYIRASRSPSWFNCDVGASDAAELPILRGELRVFWLDEPIPPIRNSVFDTGGSCIKMEAFLACSLAEKGTGTLVPKTLPVPMMKVSNDVTSANLPLGYGWVRGDDNIVWSEGPRSTLLFRIDSAAFAGGDLRLVLRLCVVSMHAAGSRTVYYSVSPGKRQSVVLKDGVSSNLPIDVSSSDLGPEGLIRITLDTDHPVAPYKRKMIAPVRRAAIELLGMELAKN